MRADFAAEPEKRRARVPHKCCECRRVIEPGRLYFIEAGVWEGKWFKFKICAGCNNIRQHIFSFEHFESGDGIEYGGVLHEAREYCVNYGPWRPAIWIDNWPEPLGFPPY